LLIELHILQYCKISVNLEEATSICYWSWGKLFVLKLKENTPQTFQ